MSAYADTGFLVSLFLEESTSAAADTVIATLEFSLLMTPLIELEFRNALNLAIVRGRISLNERDVAWNEFQEQRSGGIFADCVIGFGQTRSGGRKRAERQVE